MNSQLKLYKFLKDKGLHKGNAEYDKMLEHSNWKDKMPAQEKKDYNEAFGDDEIEVSLDNS